MSMDQHTKEKMPPAQALVWVIDGAQTSLAFLRELQTELEKRRQQQLDGALIRRRQRVVADAFAVYIASLFDTHSGTHSLVRSYAPHPFIAQFRKHEVVQKCIEHRHNRLGHQSQRYGFVIPLDLILSSNIDAWLSEAMFAVAARQLDLKK